MRKLVRTERILCCRTNAKVNASASASANSHCQTHCQSIANCHCHVVFKIRTLVISTNQSANFRDTACTFYPEIDDVIEITVNLREPIIVFGSLLLCITASAMIRKDIFTFANCITATEIS